jgi:peptidoglycan/LPS O-acetylase OafA/YrhL
MLLSQNRGTGFHILRQYTAINILANASFLHGFYPPANNTIVPGGWSIATEMTFYAAFPLLFWIMERAGRKGLVLALLLIGTCGLSEVLICRLDPAWLANNSFGYYSLLNQLPVFLMGMLTFYGFRTKPISGLLRGAVSISAIVAVLFLWHTSTPISFFLIPVLCAIAFSCLALTMSAMVLRAPMLLVRIGQRSYSIYILHFLFVYIVNFGTSKVHLVAGHPGARLALNFLMITLLSYIAAGITERLIEKPGIALGRTLIERSRRNSRHTANSELTGAVT